MKIRLNKNSIKLKFDWIKIPLNGNLIVEKIWLNDNSGNNKFD